MFERYTPSAPKAAKQLRGQERTALRAFAWSELTARIDAARDLRQVLRNDALVEATSFADAAGGYFVSEGNNKPNSEPNSKRGVNPNALEASKGLGDNKVATEANAQSSGQES
ncbi:MAG: hypothetical protein ABJP34_02750 [Erythrobacter sp.]